MQSLKAVDEAVGVDLTNIAKMGAWNLYHFDCLFPGNDYVGNPSWIADKECPNAVGLDIFFFPYTQSTSPTYIKEMIAKALS